MNRELSATTILQLALTIFIAWIVQIHLARASRVTSSEQALVLAQAEEVERVLAESQRSFEMLCQDPSPANWTELLISIKRLGQSQALLDRWLNHCFDEVSLEEPFLSVVHHEYREATGSSRAPSVEERAAEGAAYFKYRRKLARVKLLVVRGEHVG